MMRNEWGPVYLKHENIPISGIQFPQPSLRALINLLYINNYQMQYTPKKERCTISLFLIFSGVPV